MTGTAIAVLLAAAALGPPPALQVCLRQLPADPCGDEPLQVEGVVRAWGAEGATTLEWSVDGAARETVVAELVDGRPSRHLVILEPRAAAHRLALDARLGELAARDEIEVVLGGCPSALEVETVEVVPGRRALVVVVNRGPGASGAWGIRAEVGGALAYETVADSLASGGRFELLLGWDDLLARAGPGRALIPLVVRLRAGEWDLLRDQPAYRVLLPRR